MRRSLLAAALLLAAAGYGRSSPARRPASSSSVAASLDGRWVAAANPDSGSVTLLDARSLRPVAELRVGRQPRTLCFTPDSTRLAVAAQGSDEVAWIDVAARRVLRRFPTGAGPYGVVTDGVRVFVSEERAATVAAIDPASGAALRRAKVGPGPAGLALSADGRSLFATHRLSGRLTRLDAAALTPLGVSSPDARANLSQSAVLSPDGRSAYLPQTLSNASASDRNFDTMLVPVVNVVDADSLSERAGDRIGLAGMGRGVNRPAGAALSPDGRRLYVAGAGSGELLIVETASGRVGARIDVGSDPEGVAVSPDGERVYVDNELDGTLSVIRTPVRRRREATLADISRHPPVLTRAGGPAKRLTCASCHAGSDEPVRLKPDGRLELVRRPWRVESTLRLTAIPLPPAVLRGKKLFHSSASPELSAGRWVSCASCHPGGGTDGRTWTNFPDGPRNTPALFGAAETPPLHWSGDRADLQAVERTIRDIQFGRGFVQGSVSEAPDARFAGRSEDLDALAAYLASLEVPRSPYEDDAAAIARGAAAFARLGCGGCHAPPAFTDHRLHDVGTGSPSLEKNPRGRRFDTPSLRGLWSTPPYFHDGSAATLEDVLRTGAHDARTRASEQERRDLAAYLRSL